MEQDPEYGDEDDISPEKLAELQRLFKQKQVEIESDEIQNISDLKKKRKQNKQDL